MLGELKGGELFSKLKGGAVGLIYGNCILWGNYTSEILFHLFLFDILIPTNISKSNYQCSIHFANFYLISLNKKRETNDSYFFLLSNPVEFFLNPLKVWQLGEVSLLMIISNIILIQKPFHYFSSLIKVWCSCMLIWMTSSWGW